MKHYPMPRVLLACALVVLTSAGCATRTQTDAKANVAVSKEAIDNAAGADGLQFAPREMAAAREKLSLANKAMAARDYKAATELATQAQADAKLAQSKANSAKAQAVANALQDDIRVLREELDRANAVK
jgi:hypothetical protein